MACLRAAIAAFLLSMGAAGLSSAAPILVLTPEYSPLGSTIGWGFTITNDTGYVEITSAQFCLSPITFPASCTLSDLGTFTDFISNFNDIVVGPADGIVTDSVSESFDALAQQGIGSFQVAPGASGTETGQIILTYDLTDADPNDPNATVNVRTPDLLLQASASVTAAAAPSGTPEPSTLGAMMIALGLFAVTRRRWKAIRTGREACRG